MRHRTTNQERWLKFFNTVGYNALAPLYNAMDWLTFGAWWRLVRRALDYTPKGGTVLEVGFGPGKLHEQLAREADLCVGLDLAWGMCRVTRQRLQRANLPQHITRGSVFALPHADGTFDAVVSTFAFSGFPDGQNAMQELARVLAPDGRLILVDITLPPDSNRLGTVLARTWERMGDYLYDQSTLMEAAGLTITTNQVFGPGKHIKVIVGENKPMA